MQISATVAVTLTFSLFQIFIVSYRLTFYMCWPLANIPFIHTNVYTVDIRELDSMLLNVTRSSVNQHEETMVILGKNRTLKNRNIH